MRHRLATNASWGPLAFLAVTLAAGALPAASETPAKPPSAPAVAPIPASLRELAPPTFPATELNLAAFGAVGDGQTLNTEAIRRAIDTLSERGGGRLIVPPGIWLTGPVQLRSNIDLHLQHGALLQFSGDPSLYPLTVINLKGEKEVVSRSPISGEGLENVAITGDGIIDGAGDAWRPVKKSKQTEQQWGKLVKSGGVLNDKKETWWPSQAARDGDKLVDQLRRQHSLDPAAYEPARQFLRPKLLKLIQCRRVLLEGVTFQNSPDWALNPTLCDDLVIRNVTVRNPWYAQNGDGLDLESCRRVTVRSCSFDVGDDGICLKSGKDAAGRRIGAPTEQVLVEDCVVYHAHGGLTIGSEMSGGVRDVWLDNCLFLGTDIGLRFKSTRGRGGAVERIYISNVRMMDIPGEAISFNMFYGGNAPLEPAGPAGELKTVAVSEETPQFRDIYISNVLCRGAARAGALEGLPEMPLRGVHMQNVSITARAGFTFNQTRGISMRDVELQVATGPVLRMADTQEVEIDRLKYPAGAEAVIQADGTGNRQIRIRNTDLKSARHDFNLTQGATPDALQIQ